MIRFFSRNPYEWTKVSDEFFKVIFGFIQKNMKILEMGSSTGHISFKLAQKGFDVTLLDIRRDVISTAREIFKNHEVAAEFIKEDIFKHRAKYDIIWNSGLVQCFDTPGKMRLISHAAGLSKRLLLFYPDTDSAGKKLGQNREQTPGVGDAKEYSVKEAPVIFADYFDRIHHGRIPGRKTDMPFDMLWVFGDRS